MDQVTILRAACCIAGLDGSITDNEEALLRRLKSSAGVGEASFQAMLSLAIDERESYYEDQFTFLKADPEKTVRQLLEIARADGEFDQNERVVLQHLSEKIGVSAERFAEIASTDPA